MKHKYIIYISALFLVISCNQKKEHPGVERIEIRVKEMQQIDIDSIVDSVNLVPLEKKEECLIKHVDKIKIHDNKIYVLDRKSGNILVFNKTGKFLSNISKHGRGVGEYIMIADFDINPANGNLYILDGMKNNLLEFNGDKFIKNHELTFGTKVTNICFLGNERIAFETQMYTPNDDWKYHLLITDKNLKLYEKKIPFENTSSMVMGPVSSLITFGATTSYLPVYSNIIYHISEVNVIPKYNLDFGKNWIDEKYLYSEKINPATFFQHLEKSNSIYFLNTIESILHIFIYFTYKGERYAFLYDKEAKRGNFIDAYMKDGCGYNGLPIISDGEYFVGIVNPYELGHLNKNALKNHPSLRQIKEDDNPMLSFIKFKKSK